MCGWEYAYKCLCVCISVYVCVWKCMDVCLNDCVCVGVCVCVCARVRVCVCVFPSLAYLHVSPCVLVFFQKQKHQTPPKGTAELWRERQDLHHLLPAVPRDEAGEAAVSRGRDSDPAVDLHQILPSEGRTGHNMLGQGLGLAQDREGRPRMVSVFGHPTRTHSYLKEKILWS